MADRQRVTFIAMEFLAVLLFLGLLSAFIWVLVRLLSISGLERRIADLENEVRRLKGTATPQVRPDRTAVPTALPHAPTESLTASGPSAAPPSPPTPQAPPTVVQAPAPVAQSPVTPQPPPVSVPTRNPELPPAPPVMPAPPAALPGSGNGNPWWRNVLGENPVVRIGIVVFLLGVSFLVRLAAQAGLLPPEIRLGASTLAGMGLLVLGWRFRTSRPHFALPLQGGAIGTLFLVVFAAFRLYGLLPAGAALAVGVALVVATGFLAVLQNARSLAFFALASGFAAPLLLSSGSGNYIGLFTYYALLDAAVFGIALYRSWRSLHLAAFFATYVLATAWGVLQYRPENLVPCEIFLWVYYALFAGTGFLFATRAYKGLLGYVDGTLTFALPLATFALQAGLMRHEPLPLAWTAVALAVHHLVLAFWLWRQLAQGRLPHLKIYAETLAVLGTAFTSLALPLALSGHTTAIAWAMEGTGLLFLGLRQQRRWPLIMGPLLVSLAFIVQLSTDPVNLVGTAVLFVALWLCAWMSDRNGNRPWMVAVLYAGLLLVGVDVSRLLIRENLHWESWTVWTLVVVLAGLLQIAVAYRLAWKRAVWVLPGILLLWFVKVLADGIMLLDNPLDHAMLANGEWTSHLLLPLLLGFAFYGLVRTRHLPIPLLKVLLAAFCYTLVYLAYVSVLGYGHRLLGDNAGTWPLALATTVPVVVLWMVRFRPKVLEEGTLLPLAAFVALLPFVLLAYAADMAPLPYVPVLAPADLVAVFAWLGLLKMPAAVWEKAGLSGGRRYVLPALWACLWPLATAARLIHHYGGCEWDVAILWDTRALQATWTLLCTTEALGFMWLATRKNWRPVWMGGAVLLALTIVKLILVDLSGQGTVARIVSFLGAGALMVAIGYISPLPPREASEQKNV